MICYVLFIDGKDIVEDLFCQSIAASTEAQDVFEILDTIVVEDKVEWTKCVGACTDDDPSIPGRCGPLKLLIQAKFRIHCGPLQRFTDKPSKYLSPPLNLALHCVVNGVILSNLTQWKLGFFKQMDEKMETELTSLLFYCSSRWLSPIYCTKFLN